MLWIAHLFSKTIEWTIQALTEILHWLCTLLLTVANILFLVVGSLIGILTVLLVLTVVYNTLTRVWTRARKPLHKTVVVPALHLSTYECRWLFIPVIRPRYGRWTRPCQEQLSAVPRSKSLADRAGITSSGSLRHDTPSTVIGMSETEALRA